MQNIKYHALNTLAMLVFSFLLATTLNQFFRMSFTPAPERQIRKSRAAVQQSPAKSYEEYKPILDSGFFKIAGADSAAGGAPGSSAISDLQLLGTISGPPSIARALIKKNTEKDPVIFRLYGTVYGYKLVAIDNAKVYLKSSDRVEVIDMFAAPGADASGKPASPAGQEGKVKQTISRAELQQKVLNNMDNALQGLRAGPHRVDGKIQGYKLFRVQPTSILYRLGARNGDIVMRVNGHPVDSTEKLYKMWQNIQGESKITVDLDRGGKLINYDFSITE
jgi:general secretion pathway protein C